MMKILLVDDEKNQRKIMKILLESEGYLAETAPNAETALKLLTQEAFDVVITDLRMEGKDGIWLLEQIQRRYPECKVILLTGYGSIDNAVKAMKQGAYSYFVKGQGPQQLLEELKRIYDTLPKEAPSGGQPGGYLLKSKNPQMKKLLHTLERAAKSSAPILLLGESGVGKEVMAEYVHSLSRPKKNFIAVNCQALPEGLIESELFGHEKGAFTGAVSACRGRFEAAEGGTLFLDEVGDISLSVQPKLLRTLETGKIERIGSNKSIPVDFRLISATNVDMRQAIKQGTFREDLFYRLCTITVKIPPLRERREDLPELIRLFLEQSCQRQGKPCLGIPDEVMELLLRYPYRGNIRELKNTIERLVVLAEGDAVMPEDLPEPFLHGEASPAPLTLKEARVQAEREKILEMLEMENFRIRETAQRLGISERQLFNKLKEYGINCKERRNQQKL